MTRRDQILWMIRAEPGLADEDIRQRLETPWASNVNQICRELRDSGLTERRTGAHGKLRNLPTAVAEGTKGRRRRIVLGGWARRSSPG